MVTADPLRATRPALAALELSSVARGVVVLDQMVKRAETTVVAARTFSPGRYLVLICGLEAEVEESVETAVEFAGDHLLDHVILHDPHPRLRTALANELGTPLSESLLIAETHTLSGALLGLDRALKGAEVDVMELRLGAGLDGRGIFTLTGALHMIQAAFETCQDVLGAERIVSLELIAKPHPDLPLHLLGAEPAAPRR